MRLLLRKPVTVTQKAPRAFTADAWQALSQASGSATATAEIEMHPYLFVELNVDGFELLLDITAGVLVLHLGE